MFPMTSATAVQNPMARVARGALAICMDVLNGASA
jgi:hypothetical protein